MHEFEERQSARVAIIATQAEGDHRTTTLPTSATRFGTNARAGGDGVRYGYTVAGTIGQINQQTQHGE